MTEGRDPVFFFLHVMKTGGTTFEQHLRANFGPDEMYPLVQDGPERVPSYFEINRLRALTPEQRARIRMYVGHFPYVATTVLPERPITLSMLREPVDRTISLLRHRKRYVDQNRDMSLDEIYDDPWVHPVLIDNYQTRLFAMTPEDAPNSYHDHIVIDDTRVQIAKANLDRLDVLGLTEQYDAFVDEVRTRFGWRCEDVAPQRVSTEDWAVSDALRARIASDNAADVEFYAYAVARHDERRGHAARSS